jgi:hypothetical protein
MLKRDEQGNIIVAVLIIFVLVTISSAMAYRVIGNQALVLTRQNTSAGVAAADAGISDALFRLDQGAAYEGNGSEFYVKNTGTCSTDSRCAGTSIPGAPGVSYVARQVNASKWVIEATGTVNGKIGAVQETVTRSQEYPFALFGNTSLTFNGNASAAFSTYNSSAVASSSNPNSSGSVAIGSNGTITCNGGLGSNVTAAYYGTGGIGSLSSSCGTPESFSYVYNLPTPTAPTSSLTCPDNGNLGSGISGAPTVLSAGTYLCTTPVNISGLLKVSGVVSLYIILDPTVYGSSTNALTIARNSYVNDMSDYCAANSGASGCSPTPDLPNSEDLQILTNSNGTVGNDNGQGYDFGGILYAPQASLTQDGCKSQYYGSLTINTLTCNGGPHLYVSYDSALANLYGAWTAGDYTVISPSSVAIP